MRKIFILFSFVIYFSLSTVIKKEVEFSSGEEIANVLVNTADTYLVKATFNTKKYLYIYPSFNTNNNGIFKIFFKKYSEKDEVANILNSEFFTLEVNSGLFIDANKLDYNVANVFIVGFGSVNVYMMFQIVDEITFPKTTLINQFLLPKKEKVQIKYSIADTKVNEAITIIAKYSLRNFNIKITNHDKSDITSDDGGYIYPNGFSFLFDTKYPAVTYIIEIENKNINSRDEIIILGYNKFNDAQTFPNSIVNGFQLYLQRIYTNLWNLKNTLPKPMYYTYQINVKNIDIRYLDSSGKKNGQNQIQEYNSMVSNSIDTITITFAFVNDYKYIGMYIQFLDFTNLQIAQKNLQPLVSGLPKSILIPAKKSLYHFLPYLEDSKEIHYYIRSRIQNSKMYVALKTCESYPDNCYFDEALSTSTSLPLIENIGMWYTEKRSNSSLQLIYVYCETQCSYDVLMSYDEDPLFMFPDNNYTKYLGENQKDLFALPVFEYLSTYDELKIDLTVMSGKAKITLFESLEKYISNSPLNYNSETISNRQTYTIKKDTFSNANYYKKDIYVLVEGDIGSFYNLMYTTNTSENRILDNNRVFNDVIKADSSEVKTYSFTNQRSEFYIVVTTPTCKSKVIINDAEQKQNNHHLYKFTTTGTYIVKVSLITDEDICKDGFEDQIMIYAYNSDNTDNLIGENNFIWTSFIGTKINFRYLFNPIQGDDNSYNLELERLSSTKISFEYNLQRISFNKTQAKNTQKYSLSQTLVYSKNNIITSLEILSICGNLDTNEICSLTMSFSPSDKTKETSFSFYLNKNNKNYARILTQETLINSVDSNKVQYYYIELNKKYDTEIILNSFGNDLEINYEISKDKTKSVIPFSSFKEAKNFQQIHLSKNDYSSCGSYCRLYIGVHMPVTDKEMSTTFSLNYFYVDGTKQQTNIMLPLNYQSRYKFGNLDQITYKLQSYEKSNLVLELSSESKNTEFIASVTNPAKQLKSGEKLIITNVEGQITISIPNPGQDTVYRLKASSIGKTVNIYPLLSSFSEECLIENKDACYYSIDITPDMDYKHLFFFVPESEDIYMSIQEFNYGYIEKPDSDVNSYIKLDKTYTYTTKGIMQRPNWCEYSVSDTKSLLIRLASLTGNKITTNLLTSFYTRPNTVTLNFGEKRIFSIKNNDNSEININIPKASGSKNKYRINLHAIKGNFLFKILEQSYNLGLQADYKEDMSIIIDSDNAANNLVLKASIMKLDGVVIDDFSFSVDYIVESKDKLIYELEDEKINSLKFYKEGGLNNIHLYMKANSTVEGKTKKYKDVNMNIKIYTSNAEYDIKSYIVNEAIVEKCKNGSMNAPEGNTYGTINQYIAGGKKENGELTFSKLEIESNTFNEFVNDTTQLYVYLILTQKDGSQNKNVKINIYPYDMTNKKPLARNELFIQKIPPNSVDFQFLLVKMDMFSQNDLLVEFNPPSSKKYDYGAMASQNKDGEIARSKVIIEDSTSNPKGINELTLKTREDQVRYTLFDIYADKTDLESNQDYFLFKYRQYIQNNIVPKIYYEDDVEFNVTGYTNKVIFNFKSYRVKDKNTGESVIIIKGYEKSNIPADSTPFSLIFSDKKPMFTHYIQGQTEGNNVEVSSSLSGGEYTFVCLQIIQDSEREEYIGHKLYDIKIEKAKEENPLGGIIDYIKNHIFATVVIGIVILVFIAIMVNICRNEKRKGAGLEINVNEVKGELISKD